MSSLPASARVHELDLVKGFAILSVICIHARVLEETVVHTHLVNRAVPILLVLFGLAAELSWRRGGAAGVRDPALTRRWYARRLSRLVPGMWAALATCFAFEAILAGAPPSAGAIAGAAIGFAPRFGTSWFVLLILQVVLLYPLVRGTLTRAGTAAMIAMGAVISGVSVWRFYDIVAWGQAWLGADEAWYYHWVFAPRVCFHLVVGMALATTGTHRPTRRVALAASAVVLAGVGLVPLAERATDDPFLAPLLGQMVAYLLDVPLVLVLLFSLRRLSRGALRRLLAWCGTRTWGIFLGHTVLFEVLHLLEIHPEAGGVALRVAYALLLLAAGAGVTWLGEHARDRAVALGHLDQETWS